MEQKVRWGIISTANIGVKKVIPAMQAGRYMEITAIAGRDADNAAATANLLGIARHYGSYEALLQDAEIDAVYIPLPNHLHVPWAVKALQAGKHVLCEKPIALSAAEAITLQQEAALHPHLKLMEAFMYRFHPQWIAAKKLVADGAVGTLRSIHSHFSYHNTDPGNIRNQAGIGGGGLMDIGCYCISLSRWLFGAEPLQVSGNVTIDEVFGVDSLASGILQFENGTASFTCSTQLASYQRVNIMGATGRIEIEIPFNAPPNAATRIWLHTSSGCETLEFDAVDQYMLQGDLFSKAILENTPVPTSIEDAVNNMLVIEKQ
jgi:predicted dehydrogenase